MDILLYIFIPLIFVGFIVFRLLRIRGNILLPEKGVVDEDLRNYEILEIQVPKTTKDTDTRTDVHTSAFAAEHLFASLHGLLREDPRVQEHFSFEIKSTHSGTLFYVGGPKEILKFVESQIYAQYPNAHIKLVEDYVNLDLASQREVGVAEVALSKESFFPIKSFRDFEIDPLSGLMATLAEIHQDEQIWMQFLIKPVADGWQAAGHDYINMVTEGLSKKPDSLFKAFTKTVASEAASIMTEIPGALLTNQEDAKPTSASKGDDRVTLTAFQQLELGAIENKLVKMGFALTIRVIALAGTSERVESNLRGLAASFRQFSGTHLNSLLLDEVSTSAKGLSNFKQRIPTVEDNLILTNEELGSLYHLPSSREEAPNVSWVSSKTSEPPNNLPREDCNYIGRTLFRGKEVRFGINNADDRLRHMYLIGKTGAGKSTLLETMISQDIVNGEGVGVLDPHGETIDKILERIPDNRVEDVVIIDPSDTENPVGLNLLEIDSPDQKNLMASGLVSAIRQHFEFSWGPRLEYLLNYCVLTLLEVPGTTILGITRLLEDKNYQKFILHQVKDPVVRRFWEKEYKEMSGNQQLVTQAVSPIQNKIGRFLASTTMRNILAQKHSTVDFWDIMNTGKILLINLSKGKIGSDNANLLGALMVARIQFMALQRAKLSYEERKPFYLYVDEFQNFATGSFEEILSESRKYKLGLHMTHQYTAQLPEELLKAVYGNVGTIATFGLGAPDALAMADEFAPYFDQDDIISLEKFHIYIKLMIEGQTSRPFSAKILLPWVKEETLVHKTNNREKAIEASRRKYGSNREHVEAKTGKWVTTPFDKGMAIAYERRKQKKKEA